VSEIDFKFECFGATQAVHRDLWYTKYPPVKAILVLFTIHLFTFQPTFHFCPLSPKKTKTFFIAQ
jgi:hypothetical protein